MIETNREKILSLQAGRAAAAIAVAFHHSGSSTRDFIAPIPGLLGQVIDHGWLGVDFFFVLSGFIIYHTTRDKRQGLAGARDYARSRLTRIFVPYLPIGVAIMLAYWLLPSLSAADRDWSVLVSLTLLPVGYPALHVAWTLQYELIFYVVFAVAFFSGQLVPIMTLWGAAILAGVVLRIDWGVPVIFLLHPRNVEFLFGMACAVLAFRRFRHDTWLYLGIAAVALGCWGALGFTKDLSPIAGLGIAALIVPVVRLELAGRLSVPSWAAFLGAASYSLYLIHNPLLSLTVRVAARVPILANIYVATLFGVAVSLVAGCLYHLWLEKPLSRIVRQRLRQRDGAPDGEVAADVLPS